MQAENINPDKPLTYAEFGYTALIKDPQDKRSTLPTEKEAKVAIRLMCGKRYAMIGWELGVQETSASKLAKNLFYKFKAKNANELIAILVSSGVITRNMILSFPVAWQAIFKSDLVNAALSCSWLSQTPAFLSLTQEETIH